MSQTPRINTDVPPTIFPISSRGNSFAVSSFISVFFFSIHFPMRTIFFSSTTYTSLTHRWRSHGYDEAVFFLNLCFPQFSLIDKDLCDLPASGTPAMLSGCGNSNNISLFLIHDALPSPGLNNHSYSPTGPAGPPSLILFSFLVVVFPFFYSSTCLPLSTIQAMLP